MDLAINQMIELRSPTHLSLDQLASDLTRCFEGYIIPTVYTPSLLSTLLRLDSIDLVNSIVAEDEGTVVGVLIICRRGSAVRIGAMAVAEPYRRRGIGRALMEKALGDATRRQDHLIVLEAIEQNVNAIAFYEAFGFQTTSRLLGFELALPPSNESSVLQEIDFNQMAQLVSRMPEEAVVWETSPASMLQLTTPSSAFLLDGLGVVVTPVREDVLVCRSVALSGDNDKSKLSSLLDMLAVLYPGRSFQVPIIFPESHFEDLFVALGFKQNPIDQVKMELSLP